MTMSERSRRGVELYGAAHMRMSLPPQKKDIQRKDRIYADVSQGRLLTHGRQGILCYSWERSAGPRTRMLKVFGNADPRTRVLALEQLTGEEDRGEREQNVKCRFEEIENHESRPWRL
jgi:hypothetical protein